VASGRGSATLRAVRPSASWSGGWAAFALLASGCSDLPEIASDECGNGIVELGEDCDPWPPDSAPSCRPKGTSGACHFGCAPDGDGARPSCLPGWGCDANDVCRKPTGGFEAPTRVALGGASSLLAGDFDGDGRQDLVSRPPLDRLGRAPLSFHYFDRLGGLTETREFPKSVLSPVVVDLTFDRRSDLVFSGFDVGLLLGRVDRSWVPETFSSYMLPDSQVRTLIVYEHALVSDSGMVANSALVVFSSKGSIGNLLVLDTALSKLVVRSTLPGPLSELSGQPISANVIEAVDSPCDEVVFAYRGASSFELDDLCRLGTNPGTVSWRSEALRHTVVLEPPAAIDGAPQFTDMNADGHLDVLISASGRSYVALGDGTTLAAARPYDLPQAQGTRSLFKPPLPLATGDLTGDGQVDFVLADSLLTSWRGPGESTHHHEMLHINDRGAWTAAAIVDLNGNGHPDVVAVSSNTSGIDFFNGSGDRHAVSTRLPTAGPVLQLAIGDFDGDLLKDVAYVEAAAAPEERESLMIAFGVRDEPPSRAVQVARLVHTDQLLSYREEGIDSLVVTSTQTVAGVATALVTPLNGSSDRIPYSAQALISFASDESFEFFPAMTLSTGSFATSGQLDVLSVTTQADQVGFRWQLWRVPAFASGVSNPERLDGTLAARLSPGVLEGSIFSVHMQSVAADLDADGLDEFLVAAPADAGAHCAVERFSGNGQSKFGLISRGLLVVETPCTEPALAAVDLNADGARELVLLTGSTATDHQLFVFWNDQSGGFGAAQPVSREGDSPVAFSLLPATPQRAHVTLAYASERAIVFVAPGAATPELAAPVAVAALLRGTGLVAADIDGDGVLDLAAVDAGDLKLFKGQLEAL